MVNISICLHCIHYVDSRCMVFFYPNMRIEVPCGFPCLEDRFKTTELELFES